MNSKKLRSEIVDLLVNKAAVKQDIADYSEQVLEQFKEVVHEEIKALKKEINDPRIRMKFVDQGKFEFSFFIGSDVLVFQLHSNIFLLPEDHALWETDYLKNNRDNGYFAIINVYNFLAESFEKNRVNDVGYMIGRIFMNREERCIVEGKGPFENLFKDLEKSKLTKTLMRKIIECAIKYSIEFDLLTPPYEMIEQISVMQIREISSDLQVATGKRLGFRFSAEDKMIF